MEMISSVKANSFRSFIMTCCYLRSAQT